MKVLRLALCAIVGLSVAAGWAHSQILASAGFNDVTGINGDGIANNLPYNINNQPLVGQGTGEPGWFTPWNNILGIGNVVNTNTQEGDGALLMQNTDTATRILSQPLSGLRVVRTAIQVLSSATSGNGVNFYLRQQSTNAIGPNWQVSGDGRFRVVNGNEGGSTPLAHTGILWTPGSYQDVAIHVNTVTRRWLFSVDGVTFPMELGYRDAPVFLDMVDILNGVGAPNGIMIDQVIVQVPEPSSIALFGLVSCGLAGPIIRRVKRFVLSAM